MVVIKLYGGLGNQMFQYAAARALVEKVSGPLMYEGEYFRSPEKFGSVWPFQLDLLNTQISEWTPSVAQGLFDFYFRVLRKLNAKGFQLSKKYFFEKTFTFDKRFLDIQDDVFIDGYFQSAEYFQNIRNILLREFTPKLAINSENKKIIEKMKSCNSISFHFRRGDYVTNEAASRVHGTCDLDYYRRAYEILKSQVENPHFFIFSDDIDWVRNNFVMESEVTFVSHNTGSQSYLDMHLMSHCKHNVLANSSFSWWGAWLNQNSEKIVIAPKRWYNDSSINSDSIVPSSWKRI